MAKKEVNKYPLNMRGMGIEVTKDVTALRKSMALLEKEAHENGLEIAAIDGKLNALLERDQIEAIREVFTEKLQSDIAFQDEMRASVTNMTEALNKDFAYVGERIDQVDDRTTGVVQSLNGKMERSYDATLERFKRLNRRITLSLILSGVAIGMTILFTTILLSTMYNVNNSVDSGKQITIMFP